MTGTRTLSGRSRRGRGSARDIRVWDPLVRLIHWGLALAIVINGWLDKPGKELHQLIGYGACTLVGLRLIWGLIGPRPARFGSFPPHPGRALRHLRSMLRGEHRLHLGHNPAGALMTYNLWATVAAMGVTGYMMGTMRFFGVDWVQSVHSLCFDWLVASILLHLGGVAYDSLKTGVNLPRAMVTGIKRLPRRTDRR